MTIVLIIISVGYLFTLYYIATIFNKISAVSAHYSITKHHSFSLVIPFRNELDNITNLIDSLQEINYPTELLEIIFCDDHSDDGGAEIIKNLQHNIPFHSVVLPSSNSENGKKAALHCGIMSSKNEFILTTDADCTFNSTWIQTINNYINHTQAEMLVGPVAYQSTNKESSLSNYQQMENAGLVVMGASAIEKGQPIMANGANLCFRKQSYVQVNGYEGNQHLPSGDDEFLLQKFSRTFPKNICFVKDRGAMVYTYTQDSYLLLLSQRVRWASKAKHHKNKAIFLLQIFMAVFYFLLIFNIFLDTWYLGCIPLAIKIVADTVFYSKTYKFFSLRFQPFQCIIGSFLQIITVIVVGIWSLTGTFEWKNRKYPI